MTALVRIEPLGSGAARLKPSTYLGNEWGAYLEAARTGGSRYDPVLKAQVLASDRVPYVARALEQAGFAVEIDPSLKAKSATLPPLRRIEPVGLDEILRDCEIRGFRPYPFQRVGIDWLAHRDRALLADEMGTGKSCQALCAIPKGAPVVVICPATLKGNWKREAAMWRPEYRVKICKGRDGFRWPSTALPGFESELVVCNFDILPGKIEKPEPGKRRKLPEIPPAPPGTILIADEAHFVKNTNAQRTLRFRALANAAFDAGGRVWLLTGTPMLNDPGELWAVLRAGRLEKIAFGSYQEFSRLLGGYSTRFGRQWGRVDSRVPDLLNRVMLRRTRESVLPDLPVKTWRDMEVEIDADTRKVCDEVLALLAKAGIDLDAAIGEAAETKLTGPEFAAISRARAQLAIAKIPALVDLVADYEEADEPLIVFSAHRKPVEALGQREGWATVLGGQNLADRDRVVADFQAGKLKGIALTIEAGGLGITLTRSHQVVMVDLAWTPAKNKQAEDRACRIGQTRGVIVTRLVADHELDRKVNDKLARKQAILDRTTEAREYDGGGAVADNHHSSPPARSLSPSEQPPPTSSDQSGAPRTIPNPHPVKETASEAPTSPGGAPLLFGKRWHEPETPVQTWAMETLLHVAGMDPDRALMVNGVGFSRLDGEFGHSLAGQFRALGRLSEKQWSAAEKLANKYRRQALGPPPETRECKEVQK